MKRFKDFLYNHELNKPLLYQPIEHPEYKDWEVSQPCVERWEMMQPLGKPGRVIDFGCHTGWFCRQFARAGWTATGYEKSEKHIEIATIMTDWAGLQATYIVGDLLKAAIPTADIALCMSVAMYLFDDEKAGWGFFNRVSVAAKKMYMDFGGMYASRLPFTADTVIDQMKTHTKYKKGKLIGVTGFESRPFFVFER